MITIIIEVSQKHDVGILFICANSSIEVFYENKSIKSMIYFMQQWEKEQQTLLMLKT